MEAAMTEIEYYFWINSDWAYLGADRLEALAQRYRATINYMPVDLPYIYSKTGGVLLSRRAAERQAYRIVELERWCRELGIAVNPTPKYMCPSGDFASRVVIAAKWRGEPLLALTKALFRAEWELERDISDEKTIMEIADAAGYDSAAIIAASFDPAIERQYRADTERAIQKGVFGSPSYVVDGELFWGQDRLDFLERKLAAM
jgi:2-hydroxychromene-2-carboxylate isomerase